MHGVSLATTWAAFAVGLFAAIAGAATLMVQRSLLRRDGRIGWRRSGWSQMLLGAFVLVETISRLAGASSATVLAFSGVAFVPLIAAIVLMGTRRSVPER